MFNRTFSQGHLETLVLRIIEETLVFVILLKDTAQVRRYFANAQCSHRKFRLLAQLRQLRTHI